MNHNEPAYPQNPDVLASHEVGMTKLEAFTMAAMAAYVASGTTKDLKDEHIAKCAYITAKATLDLLERVAAKHS